MKLNVKVVPGSSRDCLSEWLGETLKVCVKASPEKGKANLAVVKMMAKVLGVKIEGIKVIQGKTSPRKIIEIFGLSDADINERIKRFL